MSMARIVDKNMFFHIEGINVALEGIRYDLPLLHSGGWKSTDRRLKWISDCMPAVRTLLIINADGTVLSSDREELVGRNFSMREYFKTPRRGQNPKMLYVSPPFTTVLNTRGIAFTREIQGPHGEFAGIVTAVLDPKYFATMLSSVLYAPDMWIQLSYGDGIPYLLEPETRAGESPGAARHNLVFSRYLRNGLDEDIIYDNSDPAGENIIALRSVKPAGLVTDNYLTVEVGRRLASVYLTWRQDAVAKGALFGVTTLLLVAGLYAYQERQKFFDGRAEEAAAEIRDSRENLAAEKERLAVTLRSIGDAVIVTGLDGRITLINTAAEQITGWTGGEALGMPLQEVLNIVNDKTREKCYDPVAMVLQTGRVSGLENNVVLKRRDGKELIIADSAAPVRDKDSKIVGVVLVFRDVTVQCRMEEELNKVQRLEALGLLAGGLAHDFNNLLTAIMGNISFAKMLIKEDHKAYERLTAAETAAERATNITHQLLTFAKGGAPVKEAASIADVVKETAEFVLPGSNVKCEYRVGENLWNTEIDRGQIARVFNNLIVNAVHAMPGGGIININFDNMTIAENQPASIPPGDYVRITVKDRGVGIERYALAKIFDPYFTTKKQGSGLGLAAVYSIIKRHDGDITVESTPGAGTAFNIYLPATKLLAAGNNPGKSVSIHGQGRVLVMDDEALVRDIAGEILSLLGYEVSFAEDGRSAVDIYKKAAAENRPFLFVIMDLTVPGGMGGTEAVRNLLEADPAAVVLVSSGYSSDPVMSGYRQYGFKGVIAKPYTVKRMSEAISEAFSAE